MQTIKFDPNSWEKIPTEGVALTRSVHVKLEKPGPIYIGGALAGYGTEFRATFEGEEVVKAAGGWYYSAPSPKVEQIGVPLTNMDKRPGMSSVEKMIKAQFLEYKLLEKSRAEKRREADMLTHKKRVDAGLQDENPMPEPEPVVDPAEVQNEPASVPEPDSPPAEPPTA